MMMMAVAVPIHPIAFHGWMELPVARVIPASDVSRTFRPRPISAVSRGIPMRMLNAT